MPRVSVIIPTYNHAQFVAQAVESALGQTFADREVIVVDDGSTDQTGMLLARYEGQIRYLWQPNQGVSAARNAGIAAATGRYFLFLDADDWVPADKLAIQVPILDAQPETGLTYSAFQYMDETGRQLLREIRPGKSGLVLADLLCRTLFFPPGAAVIRRECLERVGAFDESCPSAADTDLWVRIAHAGYSFAYVDRPLLQYRLAHGSMSGHLESQMRDEFTRMEKFFADPGLAPEIRGLEGRAFGSLHMEFAAKCCRIGNIKEARQHLQQGFASCPSLAGDRDWLLEWIAASALDPQVESPRAFIDRLCGDALQVARLSRQARGRYHTAAAFESYQSRQFSQVRPHILPAIIGNPSVALNRGFLRIALQSLLR
jgi:glycosyltransferase involved in cell wall biosynthesis